MLTLRSISHGLLLIETVLLVAPSFLYVLFLSIRALVITKVDYFDFCAFVSLVAIISGFRILSWLVNDGITKGLKISRLWWILASIGALLSIVSFIASLISFTEKFQLIGYSIGFFYPGIIFLPTFLHLIVEMKRQKRVLYFNNSKSE